MLTPPRRANAGFTLIELLVVIVIIAILAAIAIPTFLNQRVRAANASALSDVRNMSSVHLSATADGEVLATVAEMVTEGLNRSQDVSVAVCLVGSLPAFAGRHTGLGDRTYLIDTTGALTDVQESDLGTALDAATGGRDSVDVD